MTGDLWISKSGFSEESCLSEVVSSYMRGNSVAEPCYFMALYTDKFICAKIDRLSDALADVEWLLELRVFDEERELWAHRSMLGQPFSWRVADDKVLEFETSKQQGPFFDEPESYRIESCQKLDIDDKDRHEAPGDPQYGGKLLRSTGRSVYELPINDENAIRLVSYIRYDDNGIANVVDYRLKEFCILGEADNTKGGERQ